MKIYLSRLIIGIVALVVNITILSVFIFHLPLDRVPKTSDVIIALISLDIIFIICITLAGKEYEEQIVE